MASPAGEGDPARGGGRPRGVIGPRAQRHDGHPNVPTCWFTHRHCNGSLYRHTYPGALDQTGNRASVRRCTMCTACTSCLYRQYCTVHTYTPAASATVMVVHVLGAQQSRLSLRGPCCAFAGNSIGIGDKAYSSVYSTPSWLAALSSAGEGRAQIHALAWRRGRAPSPRCGQSATRPSADGAVAPVTALPAIVAGGSHHRRAFVLL